MPDETENPDLPTARESRQPSLAGAFNDSVAWNAALQQQRRALSLAEISAFKGLARQQWQIAKTFESPVLKALAQAQAATPSAAGLADVMVKMPPMKVLGPNAAALAQAQAVNVPAVKLLKSSELARVLEATAFRETFLQRSELMTDAFRALAGDPVWRLLVTGIQAKPEFLRWAATFADSLDAKPSAADALNDATAALAHSAGLEEHLGAFPKSATASLEAIAAVTVEAVTAAMAQAGLAGQSDFEEEESSGQHAENYRAAILRWGTGHIVVACVVLAIISNEFLIAIATLAALPQITGVTVKDLLRQVPGGPRPAVARD